jgi:hypothetical protein
MKVGSLALAAVALYAPAVSYGIGSAFATDFCIELTATEFNHRAERRGDDSACAGSHSSNIKAKATDRARDNASNAIARQCLRNVTPVIAQRACTRVNLVANTSANSSWANSPPAPKPSADKVRYIGPGSAASANLCVVAHDIRSGHTTLLPDTVLTTAGFCHTELLQLPVRLHVVQLYAGHRSA